MSENAIPVVVVGASGYTGAELLRHLLQHPHVELVGVTSRQYAGTPLAKIFPRFAGAKGAELCFSEPDIDALTSTGASLAFLALPHGVAAEFAAPLLEKGFRVIDLSADYRLRDPQIYEEFYEQPHPTPDLLSDAVYGLPEICPEAIREANLVASPGCFPTSILLPLLPLLKHGLIQHDGIVVSSMSGVSGAGRNAKLPLLYAECNESVRAYGAPKHRHLSEIEQELSLTAGESITISFTPHLVPITAGICSTISAPLANDSTLSDLTTVYEEAYADQPFVRLLGPGTFPDTKHVVGTNFIDLSWHLDERTNRALLTTAEDNLGKGAGAQAIQSFNLMHDLPQETGLLRF